jgi:hypothetical protein
MKLLYLNDDIECNIYCWLRIRQMMSIPVLHIRELCN